MVSPCRVGLQRCERQEALHESNLTDQITRTTLGTEKGTVSAPSSKSVTLPCLAGSLVSTELGPEIMVSSTDLSDSGP